MYDKTFKQYPQFFIWIIFGLSPGNIATLTFADSAKATADNANSACPPNSNPDDLIRAKVLDGIPLVEPAKAEVSQALTAPELVLIADTWNAQAQGSGAISKYVKQVQIDNSTGEIEVMFNSTTIGAIHPDSTLVYIPYVQAGGAPQQLQYAMAAGVTGYIDWGCASVSNAVASGQGLSAIKSGTLLSKYAPSDCR